MSITAYTGNLRRWIAWSLIIFGLAWVGWLIYRERAILIQHLINVKGEGLLALLLLGLISAMPNALIFHVLLKKQSETTITFLYAARLFFIGQLIKHLPGRIWNIAYQINETRGCISAAATIRINIDFMFLVLSFAILIPLSVLCSYISLWFALFALLCGLSVIALSLRYDWSGRVLQTLALFLPGKFANAALQMTGTTPYSWAQIIKLTCYSTLSWLFYFLAWQAFPLGWPVFADLDMLKLCANYSIAWFIGFITLLTPSGLGIREAAFLLMASGNTVASLALLAVIVRGWLLFNDVFLSLLFMLGQSLTSEEKNMPETFS
jgi:glycosyltransferase 2 family protein